MDHSDKWITLSGVCESVNLMNVICIFSILVHFQGLQVIK